MRLRGAIVVLLLCACVPLAPALSLDAIDANAGLMLIGSVPPATYGGPSPVVQLLGAALPLQVAGPFFIEPMLEFFGTDYVWTETNATAVPAATEDGAGFFTLGTLVSLHAGLVFPVSSAVSLGGSAGLDFLLRFPLEFFNPLPASMAGRLPALGYFFGAGRFFYPETRLFVRWAVSDSLALVVNLRAWYPLFHLWDGLGQPFYDQFMASLGLGFEFPLGRAAGTGS